MFGRKNLKEKSRGGHRSRHIPRDRLKFARKKVRNASPAPATCSTATSRLQLGTVPTVVAARTATADTQLAPPSNERTPSSRNFSTKRPFRYEFPSVVASKVEFSAT